VSRGASAGVGLAPCHGDEKVTTVACPRDRWSTLVALRPECPPLRHERASLSQNGRSGLVVPGPTRRGRPRGPGRAGAREPAQPDRCTGRRGALTCCSASG
jgi:hypothetical protein